ncbi:MAG TPA: hypothetical protein DHW71_14630 [Gammaproteobacteria bacterium]|nr:hypothetical protein [Gammaproteobacteria bacterium]MEC8011809.1 hypothetical protein [Pseudomonadota bacterium]HBF07644.1 hypothetical protein [Gammaproteobacteria bacterium]HCK94228.1 hypothetical protein [Gammaproteobacteria bacterium]
MGSSSTTSSSSYQDYYALQPIQNGGRGARQLSSQHNRAAGNVSRVQSLARSIFDDMRAAESNGQPYTALDTQMAIKDGISARFSSLPSKTQRAMRTQVLDEITYLASAR